MRKFVCCLTFVALLLWSLPGAAEICDLYDVPAATLLLPYFEVDLSNNSGMTTLFSVNNAAAGAALAHVQLWTDQSVPTVNFDIYLTGYDVQTINVRDIFNGILPRTADRGADAAADANSPSPPPGATQAANVNPFTGPFTPGVPTEFNFGGSSGPCVAPYSNPALDNFRITNLRAAHTGQNAPAYGGCLGASYGDNIARGYITVDSVTQCNLLFPSSATYFSSGISDTRNILWGDYIYFNNSQNLAQGETLVHIESCNTPPFNPGNPSIFVGFMGNGGRDPFGAAWCPFAPGEYTFYGRYAPVAGQDQREPLPTTFATRFANGGVLSGGTDLIVWRDSKTVATGVNGPYTCGTANRPAWFPLNQTDVVAFDEMENPEDLCWTGDVGSPPIFATQTCFPLETQRVRLSGGNVIGSDPTPSVPFGWMYLNLNTPVLALTYPSADSNIAQAWVTTVMSGEGRFSMGFDAIKLDSACQPNNVIFAVP